MIVPIKQIIIEGTSLDYSNKLIIELEKILTNYSISKTDIIIFGSFVLGIKDLRKPNDLDIGIRKESFDIIKKKNPKIKDQSHLHINIGNISFIKDENLPRYKNKNLFDIPHQNYKGFKVITFNQWKEMQKSDPRQKDKELITEANLIVFKGNPKYEIPESKSFYQHFKNLASQNNLNYHEYPSNIHSSKVQPIGPDDKVIGFSRGGFYADKLKNGFGAQGKFINIGAKDYTGADYYINHPSDNTSSGNLGSKSLKSHWTLTNKMKSQLSNLIRK